MFNKVRRYLKDPFYALGYDMIERHPRMMSDKYYLSVLWKMKMGYELDWNNPKTFNEKLQWLKLYDRRPEYTTLVDKYRVKQWVADRIGEQYVIPTLAVYDSVDDIDIDKLPNQFVLKCNHDSGSVVICRNKSTFDLSAAKEKLGEALKNNFYWEAREWPYKDVCRVIFAEKYLGDNLQDYRIYCFNGNPKLVYSYTNKSTLDGAKPEPTYCDIYDCDWNPVPFHQKSLPYGEIIRPKQLVKMVNLAGAISRGIPFVRVDFYECNEPVVGELTFYPGGGISKFYPCQWDRILGDWIKLPIKR